jgi:hypothetical protein
MHKPILVFLLLVLVWFLARPKTATRPQLQGEELYRNRESDIQFENAEFKFYK